MVLGALAVLYLLFVGIICWLLLELLLVVIVFAFAHHAPRRCCYLAHTLVDCLCAFVGHINITTIAAREIEVKMSQAFFAQANKQRNS